MKIAKTVQEKITLIILFIISLPFSMFIFLGYFLLYVLIFPFEYPRFSKSLFKKTLNSKYHVFVTGTKVYKKINNVILNGEKLDLVIENQSLLAYELDDIIYVLDYVEDLVIDIEQKKVIKLVDTSVVTNEFYLENKDNNEFLFY